MIILEKSQVSKLQLLDLKVKFAKKKLKLNH